MYLSCETQLYPETRKISFLGSDFLQTLTFFCRQALFMLSSPDSYSPLLRNPLENNVILLKISCGKIHWLDFCWFFAHLYFLIEDRTPCFLPEDMEGKWNIPKELKEENGKLLWLNKKYTTLVIIFDLRLPHSNVTKLGYMDYYLSMYY